MSDDPTPAPGPHRVRVGGARVTAAVVGLTLAALVIGSTAGCEISVPATAPGATNAQSLATSSAAITPTPAPAVAAPTGGTALAALAQLRVNNHPSLKGYQRDAFGYREYDTNHNGCDTRNDILRRDLTHVTFKSGTNGCVVATGTLADPYSGSTIAFTRGTTTSEAVQIDHVVALADAWQSGASTWSADELHQFGNDPLDLLAVSGPLNNEKGDKAANAWLPPNTAYRCAYVARQIGVKLSYRLTVTSREHDAMARVLASCPNEPLPTGSTAPTS
ncbi:MAG: HNH endonuclease family protein [Micrococcales bacterium]|nr:HNH endonuclease family protein [Micrococcales bacterium]